MTDMSICRADQGRCPNADPCIEKCVRAHVEEPAREADARDHLCDAIRKMDEQFGDRPLKFSGVPFWRNSALPTDSQERKDTPIYSGVLAYFPLAMAEIAKLSKAGNDKHNPGQPLHWSRGKSNDHADCIARHLLEIGTRDPDDGHLHSTKLAWRALANLQIELEAMAGTGDVKKCPDTGVIYRAVLHTGHKTQPSPSSGLNHA